MPGDIKYKDINGDGIVDKLDMVPLTHSTYPLLMLRSGGGNPLQKPDFRCIVQGNRQDFLFLCRTKDHGKRRKPPERNGIYAVLRR